MTLRTRRIQHLRPEEVLPEIAQAPVAYLPLGLLEWHGPHLPLGVDAFNAEAVALLAAEQTGGLVMPTLYFGTERERPPEMLDYLGLPQNAWVIGMDFPANSLPSQYAREEVFGVMIREQVRMILGMGFRVVVLLSGHGAANQLEVLHRIAADVTATTPARVLAALAFTANEEGVMVVGHASRVETAVMLALQPEAVRLGALPALPEPLKNADWAIIDYLTFPGHPTPDRTVHAEDDPRRASAAEGQAHMQRAAAHVAAAVRSALAALP